MKKQLLAVCVLAAMTAGLSACGQQGGGAVAGGDKAAGGDVLRIVTGSPLSGGQAAAGKDFANGAQLAADEINAKGGLDLGGKKYKLEIVSEDDAGDPKTGTTVAQKTADDSSIVAVVGHYNSGVTMVATPIYAQAGIPSITVSTNPDVIRKAPKLPDGGVAVFRIDAGDDKQGPALADFAQSKGLKKLAILDDATAYGKGIADEVAKKAKELKLDVPVRESATDKTTDFKALLTKVKAAGADGVMWGGYDDTAATLTKQARELGLSVLVLMPDAACTDNFIKLAGNAAEGTICSSTSIPLDQMAKGGDFKAAFEKKFAGQVVQAYAPLTYDAVFVLAEAAKAAGSPDKAKIAAALPKVNYEGLSGKVAFEASGERQGAQIAILEEKGGKFGVLKMVK